jgi:Protein of unknown function (DUF3309)
MLGIILITILVVLLLAAIPAWLYRSGWRYYPSGLLAVLLVVVIALLAAPRREKGYLRNGPCVFDQVVDAVGGKRPRVVVGTASAIVVGIGVILMVLILV